MTQEEKELLLKDLCARQPYKVKISVDDDNLFIPTLKYIEGRLICHFYECAWTRYIDTIKPFLRPISSMTEEEKSIYHSFCECDDGDYTGEILYFDTIESFDYLNQIHIDYRNLIPRGLAIEAQKDMYGTKN